MKALTLVAWFSQMPGALDWILIYLNDEGRKSLSEWTLGLGGSDHDVSAALMRDCDIRVAIEQERVSRRKHGRALWYENPYCEAINYCLTAEGISLSDIDFVVTSDLIPARVLNDFKGYKLREFSHHLCHAASAYLMLPERSRAGVLVYDGYGSIRGIVESNPHRNWRETFSFTFLTQAATSALVKH